MSAKVLFIIGWGLIVFSIFAAGGYLFAVTMLGVGFVLAAMERSL